MKSQNNQICIGAGCGDVGNGLIADKRGVAIKDQYIAVIIPQHRFGLCNRVACAQLFFL